MAVETTLKRLHLWNGVDDPHLYRGVVVLRHQGHEVDRREELIGFRYYRADADKGFFLNGKQTKLKGVCLHEDAGSLGTAVPERSNERRLEILKEYGCNAIRCAHNQPSPGFLDLCDRMGFLVIDEAFDKWKSGYYAKYFDQWCTGSQSYRY